MNTQNITRMNTLHQSVETDNYIVQWNGVSWELRGKHDGKTFFMNRCKFSTPLIARMNALQARRENIAVLVY